MNKDKKKIIDQYLDYIQYLVRRNSHRIIKFKLERRLIEMLVVEKEQVSYDEVEE